MKPRAEIIEFGRQEINVLTARLDALQIEWSELNVKRNAWMVILGDEENDLQSPITPPAVEQPEVTESLSASATRDKTALARQVINGTGEGGFKPKLITTKVEGLGIELPSGFISNLLFRMKRKGEVVEHDGKYYLPRFDPKPRLNMSLGKEKEASEETS